MTFQPPTGPKRTSSTAASPPVAPPTTRDLVITDEASPFARRSTPNHPRTALHRRCACPSRGRSGDDAEASMSRSVSNLPATKPHIATASTASLHCELRAEQHRHEATRGCVLRCEWAARQWHARGHRARGNPDLMLPTAGRSYLDWVSCRFFEAHCYGGPFRHRQAIDRATRYHLTDVGIDPAGWDPAALVVPVVARAASVEVPVPATVVGARAASGRLPSLGVGGPAAASGAVEVQDPDRGVGPGPLGSAERAGVDCLAPRSAPA